MLDKFEKKALLVALGIISILLALIFTVFFLLSGAEAEKPVIKADCRLIYYNGTMQVFGGATGSTDLPDLATALFTKCMNTNMKVYGIG